MTKPGFILRRLRLLFKSEDIKEQKRIVDNYNKIRGNNCYCGHTDKCSCGNPGIYEFQSSLETNSINENILEKIL